jgi:uncharacterized Zn finger protein
MGDFFQQITWPAVFAFLGAFVTIVIGAIKIIKERNPEVDQLKELASDLTNRIGVLEIQVENLKSMDSAMNSDMDVLHARSKDMIDKLEIKIEKMSDLVIQIIRSHSHTSN